MNGRMFLAALGAALYLSVQAMGAVIISHSGSTDPTTATPPWNLRIGGAGVAGTGVTHLSEQALKLTDPAGGSDWAYYNYDQMQDLNQTAVFDDPSGWKLRWRLAAENLKTAVEGSTGDEVALWLRDGHYNFQFRFHANGPNAGDGATMFSPFGALILKNNIPTIGARATGFHDFALDFDPNTGVYRLFYDGSLLTDSNATPGLVSAPTTEALLRWGGLGGNENDPRNVDSYWSLFELSTGTVPEPSSCLLLLAAGFPLLRRKH